MKKKPLNEKIVNQDSITKTPKQENTPILFVEDVKEAVRRLKEYINYRESLGIGRISGENLLLEIDKIFGRFEE